MIPGVTIQMSGREFVVAALTMGQLKKLMPRVRQLADIGAAMDENQIGILVDVVTAALQRNYPDMTAEQVEDLLDLGNASGVLSAVLTGAGLKLQGEALAGTTETISAPSTDSSPQPAAIPTL